MLPSDEAVTSRFPSELKSALRTLALVGWRRGPPIGRLVATSHSWAVPPSKAVANRVLSGLKASQQIGAVRRVGKGAFSLPEESYTRVKYPVALCHMTTSHFWFGLMDNRVTVA